MTCLLFILYIGLMYCLTWVALLLFFKLCFGCLLGYKLWVLVCTQQIFVEPLFYTMYCVRYREYMDRFYKISSLLGSCTQAREKDGLIVKIQCAVCNCRSRKQMLLDNREIEFRFIWGLMGSRHYRKWIKLIPEGYLGITWVKKVCRMNEEKEIA